MAKALELAVGVLPHFAKEVRAKRVCDYSFYAREIGRSSREAIAMGSAMHLIGGACVLCGVPVAPLHYVQRADGAWRGVFEADSLEKEIVLPHIGVLTEAARVYAYTERDFERVARALAEAIPKYLSSQNFDSPHHVWHFALAARVSRASPITFFEKALEVYTGIVDEQRK